MEFTNRRIMTIHKNRLHTSEIEKEIKRMKTELLQDTIPYIMDGEYHTIKINQDSYPGVADFDGAAGLDVTCTLTLENMQRKEIKIEKTEQFITNEMKYLIAEDNVKQRIKNACKYIFSSGK